MRIEDRWIVRRAARVALALGALAGGGACAGCGGPRASEEVSEAWTAGDEEALGVAPEPDASAPEPAPASTAPSAQEPASPH